MAKGNTRWRPPSAISIRSRWPDQHCSSPHSLSLLTPWSIESPTFHWQGGKSHPSSPPPATSCREDEFGSRAARRPSLWSLILHRSCTSLRFRVFWPSESEYKPAAPKSKSTRAATRNSKIEKNRKILVFHIFGKFQSRSKVKKRPQNFTLDLDWNFPKIWKTRIFRFFSILEFLVAALVDLDFGAAL